MNVGEFVTVFRDGAVRAWLNWAKIGDGSCELIERHSRSRDELGAVFTVWYRTPGGQPGDWRNPEDHPVRVRDARRELQSWPDDRHARVDRFTNVFAESTEPVQLVLPAYVVGEDEYLLLDGNHRAVAAFEQGCDVRVLLFALRGPLSAEVLPDLSHFPRPLPGNGS